MSYSTGCSKSTGCSQSAGSYIKVELTREEEKGRPSKTFKGKQIQENIRVP